MIKTRLMKLSLLDFRLYSINGKKILAEAPAIIYDKELFTVNESKL